MDRAAYKQCTLCPRRCAVNRVQKEVGICGQTDVMRIAWVGLHRGEEPPLCGARGSATVFFCGCPLHCAYCQNRQISTQKEMTTCVEVTEEILARLFLDAQTMGAQTLNLVTGTHFTPSIIASLETAKTKGLFLPVVWNTSGFESVETLAAIDPYVDLYLIDVKTLDRDVARRFCGSQRYVDVIREVMDFLLQRRETFVDERGILHGLLVRHLVFPGTKKATEEVLRWFSARANGHAWLSLMVQFVCPDRNVSFPKMTHKTYDRLIEMLAELGIEEGFVQELGDDIPWIPDFTRDNPFPPTFAEPLPSFLELKRAMTLQPITVP